MALAGIVLIAPGAMLQARPSLKLERVVVLMRHGVRAPLNGEVPEATRTAAPWPRWPVEESRLTDHGATALAMLGRFDRQMLAARGLIAARGCPAAGQVRIHTNTADRTITSGAAFARGFAPACGLTIDHLPSGKTDPIFEPLAAGATRFDAAAAIVAIERYTGGVDALARRHQAALARLDAVLGCGLPTGCSPVAPSRVTAAADGRGVSLSGPIRDASGTAQVLLLQYAQGLPRDQVGWGRADAATIRQVGAVHAALFDVFTRSPYMAAHQSAVFGRHMLDTLTAQAGPRFDLLMGHDTNVTALGAALGVDLNAPGYATNDVAPGGALVLERLYDRARGRRYVRVSYQAQPLAALRSLSGGVAVQRLHIPGCGAGTLCDLATFDRLLRSRLAPLR